MNKFQKVGLAVACVSSMAFADLLWDKTSPYGQVQFPWIVECEQGIGSTFNEADTDDPCFKTLGGWWFGYVAGPGVGDEASHCANADNLYHGGDKSATNQVRAKINGVWQSFVGTDFDTCEGPDVTDRSNGNSLLEDGYLDLQFIVGDGIDGVDNVWSPAIAALGVNYSTPPNTDVDISQYTDGFCITYNSDHTEAHDLAVELGWDEGYEDTGLNYGFDTWIAEIPPAEGNNTLNVRWNSDLTSTSNAKNTPNVSGSFFQENWDDGTGAGASGAPFALSTAVKEMRAFKIRLKQYVAATVNFKLIEFGFAGECGRSEQPPDPIASTPAVNAVNFELIGKTLSVFVTKSASVQIINLHGAVVHTGTVSPSNNKINLSSLSTGVYLVRVPGLGLNKITIK